MMCHMTSSGWEIKVIEVGHSVDEQQDKKIWWLDNFRLTSDPNEIWTCVTALGDVCRSRREGQTGEELKKIFGLSPVPWRAELKKTIPKGIVLSRPPPHACGNLKMVWQPFSRDPLSHFQNCSSWQFRMKMQQEFSSNLNESHSDFNSRFFRVCPDLQRHGRHPQLR